MAVPTIQAGIRVLAEEQAGKRQQLADMFLAANAAREGVTTTASGLQYEVLQAGEGPNPGATDKVSVHYRGTLIDGTDSPWDGHGSWDAAASTAAPSIGAAPT